MFPARCGGVLLIVLMSACSQPSAEPDYKQAADQLATTFAMTWNAKDGPAYGTAYWPDAELVDPTGAVLDGRDAIVKSHEELWAEMRDTTVSATVRRVRPLSPTLLVMDITVVVSGFPGPPPGATADARGDVYTNLKHVAERRGEEWKILVSQNTFLPPPQ